MLEYNDFDAVRIALASPEQIRSWSYGEVTKPETINYRTLKPERDGLFCEKIFGPTKDFECSCGKYKRIRYKGIICDKCGVEVARAKVRRERMGHIELACPVSHIWFARGIPSRLGLLLELSSRSLESVLYFSHYIITQVNEEARHAAVARLKAETLRQITEAQTTLEGKEKELETAAGSVEEINQLRRKFDEHKADLEGRLAEDIDQLEDLRMGGLLAEKRYNDLKPIYESIFEAGMGAEAILQIVKNTNFDEVRNSLLKEITSATGQRRNKVRKRLQLLEAFRRSSNKPEWMVLTVLPVLPPDLRPMVQLDGGRFATSDLNDLYRRVINRNNRLRHLLDIGAPAIIIRNEKRMLQESVDSLIDNGKRIRTVSVSGNHKLKSLSDMLRGKQGRFRQNLLGKRVDYSGRSVIVVGPELKLHQCGLPRRMAAELFKPFIMRRLIEQGLAHNIKSARRLVEKGNPEVYDILEEVVKERPVMLNRAPTLHRLSIQAFEPVLIDGSAIQLHPLVCSAFNADFDGDQMAVHIPLSRAAVKEARETMLSIRNMLLPSSGEPTVLPTLDMVLGCYYLTTIRAGAKGEGKSLGSFEEARLAYDLGIVELRAKVKVRDQDHDGKFIETSVGRLIFNSVLPAKLDYYNVDVNKSKLKMIISECYKLLSNEDMANLLDNIKLLGFRYATKSGTTIAVSEVKAPPNKGKLLKEAETKTAIIEEQFNNGLITETERYNKVIEVWMDTTDSVTKNIKDTLDRYGSIYMISTSGAKGNISQITQMAGMRGLMTDPSGKIIAFPIKSSLAEGHTVLEYFLSTHGARKGLADTALRTSDSGYLTRRLVDVAQDVIIHDEDCGTLDGIWISDPQEKGILPSMQERITGKLAASRLVRPKTDEVLVERNEEIDEKKAAEIAAAGVTRVHVRSPLTCQSRQGACQRCYGRDLARRHLVEPNTAVGIIAAQSIGEPGTQLTLRTFHTGGVVGLDITTGLPRVEELFEARPPKAQAVICEIDGIVEISDSDEGKKIKVTSSDTFRDEYVIPEGWQPIVSPGQIVGIGTMLARPAADATTPGTGPVTETKQVRARYSGEIVIDSNHLFIKYMESDSREYIVPAATHVRFQTGDSIKAGQQLTDGSANPQDILHILGKDAAQQYLVDEVQKVYRSQGVTINDKHIEVIVHQMLARVRIDSSGDTDLVPGELCDKFRYEDINAKVLAEGGEPATAHTVLMGITRASLSTDSWLAAASFQETTRVLTDAAIYGKVDKLMGLKENVIIGKIIPTHTIDVAEKETLPAPGLPALAEKAAVATLEAEEEEGTDSEIADLIGIDIQDLGNENESQPEEPDEPEPPNLDNEL
jgi:DNA-directed RNA polymerase subunit beta'